METGHVPTQFGLGRTITGHLRNLWLEVAGFCNLHCRYCFANGGEHIERDQLLTQRLYELLLDQAHDLGVDSIGIPGAGEPFLPGRNQLQTMRLIEQAATHSMFVTTFTTGQFINEPLARWLSDKPVEVMVKGAALNPDLMDRLVSDEQRGLVIEGYGTQRNAALDILMAKGFNDPATSAPWHRTTRLGLVLSLMTSADGTLSNLDEALDVLRYCRCHNLLFDADSVLRQGRGANGTLCTSDAQFRDAVERLREVDRLEFGNEWEQNTPAYVGNTCDRYSHHLYVDQYGNGRACLGAVGVQLGNIRTTTLQEMWNHPAMLTIRQRQYGGKCAECDHFQKRRCNSCLGRCTTGLTTAQLAKDRLVPTIGCWNFRETTHAT